MLAPIDKSFRGTLPPALSKDIAPLINGVMYPGSQYGNGAMYYPRTDPVLSNLVGSDEREYARMIRTSSAISGAITQRKRGLSSQGYRVVEGKSRSAAAALLRDWAEAFIAAIPRFPILRMEVLDAIYYGWRPVELQWSTDDFRFKGRPQIGIKSATAHDPWHFIFTIERQLAFAATYQGGTDPVEDPLRFMVATAGSTQSPYGHSELQNLWLLYFVAKQFEKMSGIAMQRALGLLKAIRKSTPGSITPAANSAVIDSELRGVLEKLNSNNILVESQNYSLEIIENANAASSTRELLDYYDEKQRIGIVGQNLSSSVKGGSFAATQSHVGILETYEMSDAQEELSWWNDGLLKPAIALNIGEIDDGDRPVWQSRMIGRPSLTATQTLYDMGARIDGRAVAEGFNAPLFIGPEGPEDVVLQKQAPPTAIGGVAGGTAGDIPVPAKQQLIADGGNIDESSTRTRVTPAAVAKAHSDAAERAIERATDEAIRRSAPQMQVYYSELTSAWLAANPDPKA